jgi:DNA-binding NarL/FixJ family response regulator
MAVRVLVTDDHPVVRQGLRIYLDLDPEVELVGEAASAEEALSLARRVRPDVVLMDLLMPGMDGVAAIRAFRRALPDTEVIVLTSALEEHYIVQSIQAGAIGYLLKDADPDELLRAIKAAAAGEVRLAPAVAAMLVRTIKVPSSPEPLTERETETLRLLAQGLSNKEMARILQISDATLKTHVKHVMAKLNLASRTQAALYALRIGLATLDAQGPAPLISPTVQTASCRSIGLPARA